MTLLVAILLALLVLPSPWGAIAVAGAAAFETVEAVALIWWSRRRSARVGAEALIGAEAEVVEPCAPVGYVRIQGELWRARCEETAARGEKVRVQSLDGLTLVVGR
jgi:membrane protein implicated in regulation of membrane protease activity